MKLYQIEHNNCEPYEDNYHFREDEVYKDKEKLIETIKGNGYEKRINHRGDYEFIKGDPRGFDEFDKITIHKLIAIDMEDTQND